jgi:hypothetical protein
MLLTKLLSVGWIWMARNRFAWAAGKAVSLRHCPAQRSSSRTGSQVSHDAGLAAATCNSVKNSNRPLKRMDPNR